MQTITKKQRHECELLDYYPDRKTQITDKACGTFTCLGNHYNFFNYVAMRDLAVILFGGRICLGHQIIKCERICDADMTTAKKEIRQAQRAIKNWDEVKHMQFPVSVELK